MHNQIKDFVTLQDSAAEECGVFRSILTHGIRNDRDFDCDSMVDDILEDLVRRGFTLYEADMFFSFAKARLHNELLVLPLAIPEKYPQSSV